MCRPSCQRTRDQEQGYLKVLEEGRKESFSARMRKTQYLRKGGMTQNELYHERGSPGARGMAGLDRGDVGVSSLRAGAGWTAQTGSALQHGIDLDADRAGQIGGDDDAGRDCRLGAHASRAAEPGAAQSASQLSLRSNLQ